MKIAGRQQAFLCIYPINAPWLEFSSNIKTFTGGGGGGGGGAPLVFGDYAIGAASMHPYKAPLYSSMLQGVVYIPLQLVFMYM